jgi:serine/threonine protein phosphatase PrpC
MSTLNSHAWKSFGASVIGPGHILTATPNQDAWTAFHHIWGHGIVVSDGLGSKPLSNYGSIAACRAVESAARRFAATNATSARSDLLRDILKAWLDELGPLAPKDSAATCLFALCLGGGVIHIGLLGDGCAAVVRKDRTVLSIGDSKESGFSNQTDALTTSTTESHWKVRSVPAHECEAAILCTDGVSDDLKDLDGFMLNFASKLCRLSQVTASRQARQVLERWPVPKHSDDKTIACLFRSEASDD